MSGLKQRCTKMWNEGVKKFKRRKYVTNDRIVNFRVACFWRNYLCLIANKLRNASKLCWPITFVFVLMLKSFIIIKFSYLSEVLLKDIVISSEKESRFTLFWSRYFFIRNFNVSANMFTEFWLLHFAQLQIKLLSTTFIKPGYIFFYLS